MANTPRRQADLLFDGSFEGFLCVVYAFYYEQIIPLSIQCADELQPSITQDEYFVITQEDRAHKVERALYRTISADAARHVYYAFLSSAADRFTVLLHYIILGFKLGHAVDSHLQNDCVLRVHKLAREVSRESHLLKGFCRFGETQQGIYYCGITPMHHVLILLAEHFSDRLMNQSWVIHDKRHHRAAVYNGYEYTIVALSSETVPPPMAGNESLISDLWAMYFNTLAIEARKNPKLHRRMMPLRFRSDMTEFAPRNN